MHSSMHFNVYFSIRTVVVKTTGHDFAVVYIICNQHDQHAGYFSVGGFNPVQFRHRLKGYVNPLTEAHQLKKLRHWGEDAKKYLQEKSMTCGYVNSSWWQELTLLASANASPRLGRCSSCSLFCTSKPVNIVCFDGNEIIASNVGVYPICRQIYVFVNRYWEEPFKLTLAFALVN